MVLSKNISKAAAITALISVSTAQSSNITCAEGAYVIVARASVEPEGFGTLGAVKDEILAQIPNSQAIAVPYPATLADYGNSEGQGVGNLTRLFTQYGDACPNGKIVLMGYSQGAQVVGDVLLGSDYNGPLFNRTEGADEKYINQVAAVVIMGDPANVAGVPILVGNSTKNGSFPRLNSNLWEEKGLVERTHSYCDFNDTFCDSGTNLGVHVSYVPEYGMDAAKFVVERFAAAMGNGTSSGSGNSTGMNTSTTSTSSTTPSNTSPSSPSNTNAAARFAMGSSTFALACLLGAAFTFGF